MINKNKHKHIPFYHIILHHHLQNTVIHSILFKAVDHFPQKTQTLFKIYPEQEGSLSILKNCSKSFLCFSVP